MGRLLGSSTSASFSLIMGAKLGGSGKQGQGAKPAAAKAAEPMRIAKAIAHAGLCSRRDAERWIGEGRVAVNGKVLTTPAHVVSPSDKITVDGKPLPKARSAAALALQQAEGPRHQPQGPARAEDRVRGAAARASARGLGGAARPQHRRPVAAHHRRRARAASGAAEHRLAQALSRARAWQGDASRSRPLAKGITIDGVHYGPVEAHDRPRAGQQCVADARASRRQEPRGEAARRSISASPSTG